jgi:hypothetical protein
VDGHRRYAEDPSWYAGQTSPETTGSHAAPAAWDSGVHERPSGAFRLPEQRPAGYPSPDPVTSTGSHAASPADSGVLRVPVRGPEFPPVRPAGGTPAPQAYTPPPPAPAGAALPGYNEPTSMVPTAAPSGAPEAVYNSRRPLSALLFAVATVVLLVPAVLLLAQATFVDDPAARGVVPAVLLVLGLPLTGTGLYSLAAGGKVNGRDAWLRPPIAYLPVGLLLLIAAGLAVA